MNNWDSVLKTPGQVESITEGSFTIFDSDLTGGTGCSAIQLTNNSASQTAELAFTFPYDGYVVMMSQALANNPPSYNLAAWANPQITVAPGTTDTNLFADSYNSQTPGNELGDTFQAVLDDGSSMMTGQIGNWNGTALSNGNVPCVNAGGVAGT